jgi:serine/threonine protein kinase
MIEFKPDRHRYHVEKTVGEGLSATVYRASRVDSRGLSQQLVALKVLKDENAVSYLRREFDALARVNSPHCARVIAWENSGNDCALVLEWIDGVTLLELGRGKRLTQRLVDEIVAQIAIGLRALHGAGLHHGDLHPKNVMIDRDGRVVLLDFSVQACRAEEERRGAPPYLAPELWEGAATSSAADIFALGLLRIDIEGRFSNVPDTVLRARARSSKVANEEPGLFALDPSKRILSESESKAENRSSLGALVDDLLSVRGSEIGTMVFADHRKFKMEKAVAVSVAVAVMTLIPVVGLPVRAEAPMRIETGSARLMFRSQRWLELKLNGHELGFAPVEIDDLAAGGHRIEWKTARGSGVTHLQLNAGQTIQLSADDLERKLHLNR